MIFRFLYLGLSLHHDLQNVHAHGEAVRMVEVVGVEGEVPPRYGDDEMVGRGALVWTLDVDAAVAGPREAGHPDWMNFGPREGVDHQILKYRGLL